MRLILLRTFSVLALFFIQRGIAQDYSVKEHYDKQEVSIEMRDGIGLHTTIYTPKNSSVSYPILLQRTPYSCRPYGEDAFRRRIGPSQTMMEEGYIIVYQDVRGRWNSEGVYDNMRPFIPNKSGTQTDEASDTYDTIEWLVNNVPNNNGKVGTWGISYPGFYTTYSLLSEHPALKAASPQAPIGDFYFDDFHHNGAYFLSYWLATTVFGYEKTELTTQAWYKMPDIGTQDSYDFFLRHTPLTKLDAYFGEDNVFWQQLKNHPNYDEFWQQRGIVQHLENIKPAVMVVGGLFDAEDLYGPWETYKNIEARSNNYNTIVMGPWSHGDWARLRERQAVGNVFFGENISAFYQTEIEATFFRHFLKESGNNNTKLPEALVFDTGAKAWKNFTQWPPKKAEKQTWHLNADGTLGAQQPDASFKTFISDPKKPVPYTEDIKVVFTPRKYMSDDQRFAARRPDVVVYETEVLEEDVTLAGSVFAQLMVSTTGTDADWVVKLIDVYPHDYEDYPETQDHLKMSNYHQMVRSEVIRGKYRKSFANPEAFEPNTKTKVSLKLQDVLHTFKKGHKIQIQVQSTWFPLIDINPQTYVENIFYAKEEDFKAQTHQVYSESAVEVFILKQ
ncbi:MAG: CocE/NonD family hydrolase [Flavobacteriaceae bacterium]|nr:CocE/NonD family hydrolase [Flavobacteriaceae bacterium]